MKKKDKCIACIFDEKPPPMGRYDMAALAAIVAAGKYGIERMKESMRNCPIHKPQLELHEKLSKTGDIYPHDTN